MPSEWLIVLACAGYVAPYAWDRWRMRVKQDSLSAKRITLADGSFLNVPARMKFRKMPLRIEHDARGNYEADERAARFAVLRAAYTARAEPGKRYADLLPEEDLCRMWIEETDIS